MSTTMVGEEVELKETPDDTDGGHKETKKAGLINAFFQPIKAKQHTKTSLGKEIPESSKAIEQCANKAGTGLVQESSVSGPFNIKDAQTSKKKTSELAGKSTSDHTLSHEEALKPKQSKPKWSVTCAVRNSSKYLNSSGSDFEDDGKGAFDTKTKQAQKSGKKKAKSGSSSNSGFGTKESERNSSETADVKNKDSKAVLTQKFGTSKLIDEHNKQHTAKIQLDDESKALEKSKNSQHTRTSAFDILMKSQRIQKLEDKRTETSLEEAPNTGVMSCDGMSENSVSCEIVDDKETLQSGPNVTSQSKVPTSMTDSLADRKKANSSPETNAFDFLMKKGRLGKSPSNMDSQPESEIDSEVLENTEASLKKKSKKKSFEFKLSIRASKKNSDVVNCEEQANSKVKKKTRKHKKAGGGFAEGGSDESFVSEKCEEVVRVSKSKRGRKKSKVKSEEDQADISLSEVTPTEEGHKSDKKEIKERRRKRVSGTKKVTTVANDGGDVEVIEPACVETAQNKGRKVKQQRNDNENTKEVKDKKVRKPRKRMKCDTASLSPQSLSTECQETSACDPSNTEDGDQAKGKRDETKQKSLQGETLPSTDDEKTICRKKNKVDNDRETVAINLHHKETSICSEPKALASIFLKRKPIPSKPETTEESPTTAAHLVPSSTTAESSVATFDTINKCSTSDMDSSQCNKKSAAEQEAANKAFKALFTGASSQKSLPTSTAAVALPAPWPLVSHVFQKDEDVSLGANFWCLPSPAGQGYKSNDFSNILSLAGSVADVFAKNSSLPEDRVMFCGRRHFEQSLCDPKKLEKEEAQQNFPEAVTKKLLLELALLYPGVPLRKLYKRYASKMEKQKSSSVAVESKQAAVEKSIPVVGTKNSLKPFENNEEKHDVVSKKKGRGKWRLSSDGGGVSQEKKITRKCEDFSSSLPSNGQDLSMDQSVSRSCKKRQREEDGDQSQEKTTKGRRLSLRLQKKKTTLESESIEDELEQPEPSLNRNKRRRTSDHQKDVKETSKPSIELDKPTDAPVTSSNESSNAEGFINDALWTDLYRPIRSTEVMANASAVSKLRSWLEEWKIKREKTLRKELQQQKRLLAIQKGKSTTSSSQGSGHMLEWWDDDSDSDFQMSDNDLDDSDTEGGGLSTAMFISGPTGVGKTAMVYACAEELGYKVFEVNSSSKRSGKHILSQLEEATQSHLVINNKGPPPQSSFAGLLNKPVNNSSPASGPLGAFLKTNANVSETKNKKEKGKKQKNLKEKKKDESKGKGKSILKQPSQALNDDTESCSNLSSKAASLILFEEVDVIFEEDKSFWMAVNSFLQNAKCPIVLISTESQVSCEGRYEQINLKPPSVNLLAAHLQLVALTNNFFVNPEDLKSLVAQNNCDIRKSLLNLQVWSASGGGVKIPYKRPVGLKEKGEVADKHPKPQHVTVSYDNSTSEHAKTSIIPSQDFLQFEPPVSSGILNDDGEESMFLSLSDWQAIKNKGARRSSRTSQRGGLRQAEGDNNSDSDFCEPKKKMLVCTDGSTDSIFEITDTNDSQPVSNADKSPDDSLQLPLMDSLLFESSHGLLNCVTDQTIGSLSVLQKKKKPGDIVEDCDLSDKLRLTHFSQGLGLNLIHVNVGNLIPLFADLSSSSPQTKLDPLLVKGSNTAPPITENVEFKGDNIFSDKSLFDDGIEESVNKVENDSVTETDRTVEKDSEDTKARAVHSSQDSTDTGFSESQSKEVLGEEVKGQENEDGSEGSVEKERKLVCRKPSDEEKCCSKALEIFAQFAENMSFLDAFCPSLSVSNTQSTSADFGWWGASLKPGLTDEHVTVQECGDWLACDTRASLRGALEVANLESCHVRIDSLAEDLKEIENSTQGENTCTTAESELFNFRLLSEDLPPRDSGDVVRLDGLTQIQKSTTANRRKLHSCLGSCIPNLYHCDHRCVASDYIPTLRLLCHSERLREAANIKRRFLHYLNFNSFPMSRSTMEALADSYLAQ